MPMLQCSRIGARHGRNPCPRAKGRRAASFFQTVRRRSAVPALQTAEATRTILSTASASVQACSRFRRKKFIGVMEWTGRRSWVAGQMETKCKSPTMRHWHRGHSANRVTKSLVLSERIGVPPIILATHQILCMCQREVGHKAPLFSSCPTVPQGGQVSVWHQTIWIELCKLHAKPRVLQRFDFWQNILATIFAEELFPRFFLE